MKIKIDLRGVKPIGKCYRPKEKEDKDIMKIMLDKGAYIPERAHAEDAGYDLRTPLSFDIKGFSSFVVATGIHVQIPHGYAGLLISKSGLNVYHSITATGLIDSGYTGEIVVKLYKNSAGSYHFNRGDKIVQLVIIQISTPKILVVDEFQKTERGDNGFGSTGK